MHYCTIAPLHHCAYKIQGYFFKNSQPMPCFCIGFLYICSVIKISMRMKYKQEMEEDM